MMDATTPHYRLSSQVNLDGSCIRSLCATRAGTLLAGSRDFLIRELVPLNDGAEYIVKRTIAAHENDVAALLELPPSDLLPNGGFASAGYDNAVHVWHSLDDTAMDSDTPVLSLIGHERQVCSLGYRPSTGQIISGSWDSTVRVWQHGECAQVLEGPKDSSAWDVLPLPNGDIVVACSDRTIKIWRDGAVHKVINGHQDVVRGLADVAPVGFLSCANDGLIFLWSYTGELLRQFIGHTDYIYRIARLSESTFVSCGEDAALRIWSLDGECLQAIPHPTALWSIGILPNGDIATGGMDGVLRIWTQDPARFASRETLMAFDVDMVRAEEESRKIGDLDASKVKGPEALASPGSHDGEILLVRQATKVRAFKWDAATRDWELVGDVTDAKNNVIDGVEYDQVINVTLDDGNRRLGYMNGENPYIAAQRFLLQNEDLPRDYEDQIVDFIIRNLERRESQTLTMGGGLGGRADPITGNSGWHPSAAAPAAAPAPAIRAPTTDPSKIIPLAPTYSCFPQQTVVLFSTTNFEKLRAALNKLLDEAPRPTDDNSPLVTAAEREELSRILTKAEQKAATTRFTASQYDLVLRLLEAPTAGRAPFYDILRNVLLLEHSSSNVPFVTASLKLAIKNIETAATPVERMLLTWAVANAFRWRTNHPLILEASTLESLLDTVANVYEDAPDTVLLGLVTILLNLSVLLQAAGGDQHALDQKARIMSLVAGTVASSENAEILFRVLVCVGTLVFSDASSKAAAIDDWDLPAGVQAVLDKPDMPEKVTKVAKELQAFLAAK